MRGGSNHKKEMEFHGVAALRRFVKIYLIDSRAPWDNGITQ